MCAHPGGLCVCFSWVTRTCAGCENKLFPGTIKISGARNFDPGPDQIKFEQCVSLMGYILYQLEKIIIKAHFPFNIQHSILIPDL